MDHLEINLGDEFRPHFHANLFDPVTPAQAQDVYMSWQGGQLPIEYSFHDFPEKRCGWKLNDELEFEPVSGMIVVEFERFFQSWLFFGLLKTVIQLPDNETIDWAEFIINDHVHTKELKKYLERWRDWEDDSAQRGTLGQTLRMIRAQVALDHAREVVLQYCSVDGKRYKSDVSLKNSPHNIPDELSLSLMVLGETLTAAKSKIVEKVGFNIRGWHGDINEGWGNPHCVLEKMKNAWCPRTIHMLIGQLSSHATSLLTAYKSQPDSGAEKQHAKCTKHECYVKSMDSTGKSYKTQHHPQCPDETLKEGEVARCYMIGPDINKVLNALHGSYFPLLKYAETDGKATLDVVKHKAHQKYATISHVWADGYGNPESNEIRKCQLDFFMNLFTKLPLPHGYNSKNLPFWIDTLAIPVGRDRVQTPARKNAITKIHDIFTKATYTVVIDNGLTKVDYGTKYEDTAMKILASGWMRRLWTLQEAYLSKRLFFAFTKNNLKHLDDLEEMYPEANDILTSNIPDAARNYFLNLLGPDRTARINGLQPTNGFGLLANVWRAAQWRTTTHPQHETLALATLLNVDNSQFISGGITNKEESVDSSVQRQNEETERLEKMMKDLWVLLDETAPGCIPPGIIFLAGKRLSIPSFGWAPFSWMSGQEVDYPDPLSSMTGTATLSEKGLSVQYPGFLLHSKNYDSIVELNGDNDFHFPIDSTLLEWYTVSWKDNENRLDNPPKGNYQLEQLAIILCRPRPRAVPEIGLLVEVKRTIKQRDIGAPKEYKVYCVYVIRRLKIKREVREDLLSEWRDGMIRSIKYSTNEGEQTNTKLPLSGTSGVLGEEQMGLNRAGNLIFGEVLDSSQKWYVDGRPKAKSPTEVGPPPKEPPKYGKQAFLPKGKPGPISRKCGTGASRSSATSPAARHSQETTSRAATIRTNLNPPRQNLPNVAGIPPKLSGRAHTWGKERVEEEPKLGVKRAGTGAASGSKSSKGRGQGEK